MTSPAPWSRWSACRPIDALKSCEAPHGASDLVHYVVVRGDLSPGQKVAQAIHATGESSPARVPRNTIAVALQSRDAEHLLDLHARLVAADVACVLVAECDGEPMAIGCEPTRDRDKVRRVLSQVPLVK